LQNSAPVTLAMHTGTIQNDDIGGMNDTGITTWSDAATSTALTVAQASAPGQDADHGRDALAAGTVTGGLTKVGGSSNAAQGFDFTKLDNLGNALFPSAVAWSCVKDNATGLYWEVKSTAAGGGIHDANNTYIWYDSNVTTNGGIAGTADTGAGATCNSVGQCDTEKFVAAVNTAGLCGFTDWRLPTREELRTIADYNGGAIAIDSIYFPNATATDYWSSQTFVTTPAQAWTILFSSGIENAVNKTSAGSVRLVRKPANVGGLQ